VHAGPRPFEDEAVLGVIRESLLAGRMLRFRYQGGRTPGSEREVTPAACCSPGATIWSPPKARRSP
jgi:predicted DNA-binding transcriptional regulator YafY